MQQAQTTFIAIVHGFTADAALLNAGRFLRLSVPDCIIGGVRLDLSSGENDAETAYSLTLSWAARMTLNTNSPTRLKHAVRVLARDGIEAEVYAANGDALV